MHRRWGPRTAASPAKCTGTEEGRSGTADVESAFCIRGPNKSTGLTDRLGQSATPFEYGAFSVHVQVRLPCKNSQYFGSSIEGLHRCRITQGAEIAGLLQFLHYGDVCTCEEMPD